MPRLKIYQKAIGAADAAIDRLMERKGYSVRTLVSCLGIGAIEVAFPEVERDLTERTLFPLFDFCKPENSTVGIQQGARSADKFLAANFDELIHELHSCGVKPIKRIHHGPPVELI
jgi:hypothetical protein